MLILLSNIGRYIILINRAFSRPDNFKLFFRQLRVEITNFILSSVGLVGLISIFMGAVATIQTASNITIAFIPKFTIGFATRQAFVLEFAPTVIALILSGKLGSNIASEIGSMKISEQIDALKVMGINVPSFLILPKITASLLASPFLVCYSIFFGLFGGYLVAAYSDIVTIHDYTLGLTRDFSMFSILYTMIKTVTFAFIYTSIPAYYGYYASGGAVEVGKSSTRSVVVSSILILIFNYIITQLMLI